MENLPKKKRGRPKKIRDVHSVLFGDDHPLFQEGPAREMVTSSLLSPRQRANLYYAERAREAIEGLRDGVRLPEDPVLAAKLRVGYDWILNRSTVLSELGRMMTEEAAEEDVRRFQEAAAYVAAQHELLKMNARGAAAYVRRMRLGETKRKDRIRALHHDLNAAINLHRRRYPESTWEDVHKALEHTVKQIERKLPWPRTSE